MGKDNKQNIIFIHKSTQITSSFWPHSLTTNTKHTQIHQSPALTGQYQNSRKYKCACIPQIEVTERAKYSARFQELWIIIQIHMDQPVVLNEEIPQKYESYSSSAKDKISTLDEPVIDTIKRDVMDIYEKIKNTVSGSGNYDKIKQQWDLWGPLVISLVTASMGAFGTGGSIEEAFTILFLGMWLGPLIITVNANLLGAECGIMQTLCLIVYCSTPIMLLSIAVFLMNVILHSFLLNLVLAGGALAFILKTNKGLFKSLVAEERQYLSLYPVFLFYTFMCLFIAMT